MLFISGGHYNREVIRKVNIKIWEKINDMNEIVKCECNVKWISQIESSIIEYVNHFNRIKLMEP